MRFQPKGLSKAAIAYVCFFFISCVSMKKSSIKDDGTQIPPGFGTTDATLLVIRKDKNSYDKYLEKNFEECYFGKYLIISVDELENKKYKDTNKYPYVFNEDLHQDYIASNNHSLNPDYGLNTYAMFYVQDRRTGDIYKTKHGTGSFSKWMRAYIVELEKARQKYSKKQG